MTEQATAHVKKMTVSAIVTRADGTVEDLGVIDEGTYEAEQPPAGLKERIMRAIKKGND